MAGAVPPTFCADQSVELEATCVLPADHEGNHDSGGRGVETEWPRTYPAYLRLEGEAFGCVGNVPQWHLMKLAKAYRDDDEMAALAGMIDFFQVLVDPSEWKRFDAFMGTVDLGRGSLDNAIGDALVEMGGRGKASVATSGPSSAGSPTTPPTARVVSLSQGTVDDVRQPSLSDAATSSTA